VKRYRMPAEWADFGARWGNDGLLYLAEWRRGFDVHELRALFFECQQVRSLTRERDTAQGELEAAATLITQLEKRIAWYRRQVAIEARLFPLLMQEMP
jgi:hypothetical protein